MLIFNGFNLTLKKTSFVGNVPNCVIVFMNNPLVGLYNYVSSDIVDLQFAYGRSDSMFYGGGLSLAFLQTSYTVYVNVNNVTLCNNSGMYSNFVMIIGEMSFEYTMVLVEKVRSSRGLWHTVAGSGFALLDISDNSVVRFHQKNHSEYTVHIVDSFFEASNIGETAVRVHRLQGSSHLQVKFTDIIIRNREGNGMFISNML